MQSKFEKLKSFIMDNGYSMVEYKSILNSIFRKKIWKYEEIVGIPVDLKDNIMQNFWNEICSINPIYIKNYEKANKIIFQINGWEKIETVNLSFRKDWEDYCISSQCWCNFGCDFCSTGKMGLRRNLTVEEITDQILYFYLKWKKSNWISFMWMWEPLSNPNIFNAIKELTDQELFGLNQDIITISTIWIIPNMYKLFDTFPNINLTFSLHSPFTEQRTKLMPINAIFPLYDVIKALDDYIKLTGKEVYLAYTLINWINDSKEHAEEIFNLLHEHSSVDLSFYHIDLIPYNSSSENSTYYKQCNKQRLNNFIEVLNSKWISNSVRSQFWTEINAGCWQLYNAIK